MTDMNQGRTSALYAYDLAECKSTLRSRLAALTRTIRNAQACRDEGDIVLANKFGERVCECRTLYLESLGEYRELLLCVDHRGPPSMWSLDDA